jgi:hypothetical protein
MSPRVLADCKALDHTLEPTGSCRRTELENLHALML